MRQLHIMNMLQRLSVLLFFVCIFIPSTYVLSVNVPAPILSNINNNNGISAAMPNNDPTAISVPAPVMPLTSSTTNSEESEEENEEEEEENTSGGRKKITSTEGISSLDEDKKHVHRYVDKLLGLGDTEETPPESLNEASVATQIRNLQKNIKALQISLESYERSKKSSKSKANILYSKIKSAFREYFGGEIPGTTQDISPVKQKRNFRSQNSRNRSSINKKYTVKSSYRGGYPTKSYGKFQSRTINYPTKFYGKNGKYTVKTSGQIYSNIPRKPIINSGNYPTKSYGTTKVNGRNSTLPKGTYTVKNLNNRSYFNKKCCGN